MRKRRNQSENSPERSLESKLRNLTGFAAPATLRAKLFGDIPDRGPSSRAVGPSAFLRRTWTGAAAAVFVIVLAIFINYGPSISPNRLITEVNIASAGNNVVDQNSTYILDTNQANLLNP